MGNIGNEYLFESSALQAAAAGSFTDGQEVKAGTNDFFTLYMSAKTKIDSSSKVFDDEYASEQRVNFGGKVSLEKNAVKFTTEGPASVKIWWVEGGDDNRQQTILNAVFFHSVEIFLRLHLIIRFQMNFHMVLLQIVLIYTM